jgi:hypothetical protein
MRGCRVLICASTNFIGTRRRTESVEDRTMSGVEKRFKRR